MFPTVNSSLYEDRNEKRTKKAKINKKAENVLQCNVLHKLQQHLVLKVLIFVKEVFASVGGAKKKR